MLGFAALAGATVAIVLLILLSDGGTARVTPLPEDKPRPEQRRERGDLEVVPGTGWLATPARDRLFRKGATARRRARSGGRRHELPPQAARRIDPRRDKRNGGPVPRSGPRKRPHLPSPAPAPVALPAPGSYPSPAAPITAPLPVEPVPANPDEEKPHSPSKNTPPESPPVILEIEDGELEDKPSRVHPQDGRVRLRVRSDQLVIVEVEDHPFSKAVPAGVDSLIEFDASSKKGLEVELRRRKGVLVLRLDD